MESSELSEGLEERSLPCEAIPDPSRNSVGHPGSHEPISPSPPNKTPTVFNSPESHDSPGENFSPVPNPKVGDPNYTPTEWEPQVVEGSLGGSYPTPGVSERSGVDSYVTAEEEMSDNLPSSLIQEKVDATFQSDPSIDISGVATFGDTSESGPTEDSTPSISTTSPLSQTPSILLTPSTDSPSIQVTSPDESSALTSSMTSPDESSALTPSMTSFQRDSSDPVGDSDEEYFEEFHLPNTHENAFVRHLSFRRKVQTTPINAPDAERIEGLVRTGEFIRHGSIRKRIVPEEELEEEEEEEGEEEHPDDDKSSSFSKRIERDLREIERYLSEDNLVPYEDDSMSDFTSEKTPAKNPPLKRVTSTPKTPTESELPTPDGFSRPQKDPDSSLEPKIEEQEEESRIEDSTLRKIQDCLDFSSYKDLLNLSGRLSDLLSPKEVEEVLHNSERYRQYLDSEVFEALSLSFQGQTQSLPYNINVNPQPSNTISQTLPRNSHANSNSHSNSNSTKSIPNTDSGFSSPKSPKEEGAKEDRGDFQLVQEEEKGDRGDFQLVRHPSVPIEGIGAEGIFLEAAPSNPELRRIPAPALDLDWSSETRHNESDVEPPEPGEGSEPTPRKRIVAPQGILNASDDGDFAFGSPRAAEEKNLGGTDQGQDLRPPSPPAVTPDTTKPPTPDRGPAPPPPDLIPELTSAEELSEVRHWRNVVIGGAWRRIDMKVIAPYKKCISHGGYMEGSQSPIVVLSAALLPEKNRKDYHYIMDNLFMFVLSFLEQLVSDDYVLVYFSGGSQGGSGPGFHWMRRAYEMIDRRLRKNLKSLLVVHPSIWARTLVALSRPFISAKFYRKLRFVPHLTELAQQLPLEQLEIPDAVKQADFQIMIKEKKRLSGKR